MFATFAIFAKFILDPQPPRASMTPSRRLTPWPPAVVPEPSTVSCREIQSRGHDDLLISPALTARLDEIA
jgi:hypothetical protein